MDWTYLLACVSWGLTTGLMLYVKLRKKSEAFPVLILVGAFLLYMNSGDVFSKFRIYNIATANRKLLANQFIVTFVFGFLSNSYADLLAVLLVTASVTLRTESAVTIPFIGPFLVNPVRRNLLLLGIGSQCVGLCLGSVASVAMIADAQVGRFELPAALSPAEPWQLLLALSIALFCTQFAPLGSRTNGLVQTFFASAIVAAASRSISLYTSPLVLVPVLALLGHLFPNACTSVAVLLTQLACGKLPKKFLPLCTIATVHATGALLARSWSPDIFPEIPYVSRKAIAQEFFFSTLIGFCAVKNSTRLIPLLLLGAWLATVGPDMVHLSSAISFGAIGLDGGRLLARLIWQTAGSLFGATLVSSFADKNKIDFDWITTNQRRTDGSVIKQSELD